MAVGRMTRARLAASALLWLAAGPASAMGTDAGDGGPEQAPRQTFLGGEGALGAELESMERAGQAVVRALADAPGPAETRFRRGELELHMAMRPEFGPANAALFGRRHRALEALARALGLESRRPAERGDLDRFASAVGAARRALEARGFAVESSAAAGPMSWSPAEPAWSLVARDESRTVVETVPYAASAAPERKVHPRLTLLFAVPRRLRSSSSLVRREQPAEPVGALDGALVFIPDPAQARDQDDGGRLRAEALAAVFPGGAPSEVALAADRKADLAHGLLRLAAAEDPPQDLAGFAAPGARALLWTQSDGPALRRSLLPLE